MRHAKLLSLFLLVAAFLYESEPRLFSADAATNGNREGFWSVSGWRDKALLHLVNPKPEPAVAIVTNSATNSVSQSAPGAGGNSATNQPAETAKGRFIWMSMDEMDDKHPLKIGDKISFRIVEDRDEPKPLMVTDTGELEVPYIGRVNAAGKPCRSLAYDIKALLEKEYYNQATVLLGVDSFKRTRGRVYLLGQLRLSGPIEIPGDEDLTLGKAIILAGGFGDFADRRHVKLYRKGVKAKEGKVIDAQAVLEKGRADLDVKLDPEDMVFVPARMINFQ